MYRHPTTLGNPTKTGQTLDSWSVWALTDYYLAHPEKFKHLYLLDENLSLVHTEGGFCYHTIASNWTKDSWLGE